MKTAGDPSRTHVDKSVRDSFLALHLILRFSYEVNRSQISLQFVRFHPISIFFLEKTNLQKTRKGLL